MNNDMKEEVKEEFDDDESDETDDPESEDEEDISPSRRQPARGKMPNIRGQGRSNGRPKANPSLVTPHPSLSENDMLIGDFDDPFALFFDNIISIVDNDGDPIAGPFLYLPSKKEYPDYFQDIENPIALNLIRAKVLKGKYRSLIEMEEVNTYRYLNEGNVLYNYRM